MPINTWRAVLTDMEYEPVGELVNASERTLSMTLNRTDTASFKIRTDHQFAALAQSLNCYLKLYRNDQIMFFGLLLNSQESVGEDGVGHITCNAAGPSWVWPKRFPAKGALPTSYTGTRANIMGQLLTYLDTQYTIVGGGPTVQANKARGETAVTWDTPPAAGASITYAAAPYKPMAEIVTDLSSAADGFDWRILARENWDNGTLLEEKTGTLVVGAPLSTDSTASAIFEFGYGRVNVKGYERTRSRETQGNGFTHLLNGQPELSPAFETLIGYADYAGAGVMEEIIQADLTTFTLRDQLVSEHLEVRIFPRDIIQFTPSRDFGDGRLPRYGIDYNIGDTVTGRAVSNGVTSFDGIFRVWGVNFAVDEAGIETPTLLLQEDTA